MMTTTQRFLSALSGATLVLAVVAWPAAAHNVGPAGTNSAAASAATATGTVNVLVVDNTVTGLTLRYIGLKQDDGHSIALVGTGLDTLARGNKVSASGSLNGNVLRVASFVTTTTATGSGKATAQGAPTQLQGTLLLYHLDFFDEGRGEYGLAIASAEGKKTLLNVAVIPDTLQPGMKIVATGTLAADAESLDVTDISVVALPPLRPSDVTVDATNNVLVLPIKFSDSPGDSFTPDQINTEFQTKVAPYFSETSYGQQLLNITVACSSASMLGGCAANTMPGGWLKGSGTTPTGCAWQQMGTLADAAATAAGYNVNNYANKYYVLPANSGCGWAGLAYVGLGLAWSANVNALWVYGHELGHNFGLYHAGSMDCGASVIGTGCGIAEYGDRFDLMGNIRQMHFNAMQKQRLNWIPASSVKTHTSGTTTYQLSPLETGGQSTYAVKIPTSNSNRTYWVEFRQPIGFDSPLSTLPNLGAQIRVQTPIDSPGDGDDTKLLDLTPGDGNFDNSTLLATAPSYVDSTTGVTISVNSATAGASGLLTVTVAMGGGKTNTTTTLATSGTPANLGVSVTFTATVVGSAPTSNVAFSDGSSTISGCSGVALTGSGNIRTAACTTSGLTAGTHSIVATYAGDGNNNPSTSATLSQTINAVATTNFALASNGGAAFASSSYSVYLPASSVINNDRKGLNWGNGGGWADGTPNTFPDWVSVNFNGMKSISSVVVYTLQDNYTNPIEPTDTLTFSSYGVTDFAVQAWVNNAWQTLATVTGNNLVKKTVNFSQVTTDRIRIYITGAMASSSRITEIEAWGVNAGNLNVASVGNGGVASASSVYYTGWLPVATVNDSERAGMNWGLGNGWADGTPNTYPDWVQILFSGQRTISSVVVYTVQDAYYAPSEPTDTMTFTSYGITDFNVQYWNGSAWVTLGSVTGNNLVKKTFNFTAVTTDRIRVNINNALASSSRLTEIEAWGN